MSSRSIGFDRRAAMAGTYGGTPPTDRIRTSLGEAPDLDAAGDARERTVRAGDAIVRIGGTCGEVFIIDDGWACLYALRADGGRQILHYAIAGDLVGYHPAHLAVASYGAVALTDVTARVLSRAALDAIARSRADVAMEIARLLARDLALSYDHLTSVARQCARERVAHLLLQLYVRRRTHWPNTRGDQIDLPLTQELIADTLGLTPVHVNRVLAMLRRDGVLHFKLGKLRILDPDRLIDIAGLEPDIVSNWIDSRPSSRRFGRAAAGG